MRFQPNCAFPRFQSVARRALENAAAATQLNAIRATTCPAFHHRFWNSALSFGVYYTATNKTPRDFSPLNFAGTGAARGKQIRQPRSLPTSKQPTRNENEYYESNISNSRTKPRCADHCQLVVVANV